MKRRDTTRNFEISMENQGPEPRIEQECDTGKQSNHNNSTGDITVKATQNRRDATFFGKKRDRAEKNQNPRHTTPKNPKPETHNPTKTQTPRHTPQKPKPRDTPHKNPTPGTHPTKTQNHRHTEPSKTQNPTHNAAARQDKRQRYKR